MPRPATLAILLTTLSSSLCSCGSPGLEEDESNAAALQYDYSEILHDEVYEVILPTYLSLKRRTESLHDAIRALEADTTEGNLTAAKQAWRDAREPWEQSEAFLFGPVAHLGLDPALDTWPVDRVQLDDVMASGLELSAQSITENLGGGLKGFHTIEYLLWGDGGADDPKPASALASEAREMAYLLAATDALRTDATTLHDAWADDGDAFGRSFSLSGTQDGLYSSQLDAVAQLVGGMVDICDEVANGKIADPFDEQSTQLVESRFSFNSVHDFSNNLKSVKHVYLGREGEDSATLSTVVQHLDPALDERLRSEIDEAIAAILAMTADENQSFREAVVDDSRATAIEAAQRAIRSLMRTLQSQLLPLLRG